MADSKADIAPKLLEDIQSDFKKAIEEDHNVQAILAKLKNNATYAEGYDFAIRTGELLAQAMHDTIRAELLPDGKMHYPIAKTVLEPLLQDNHQKVSSVCAYIQKELNASAGIGLKPVIPPIDEDRLNGLIEKVASYDTYDEAKWVLSDPIVNFSQHVVDASIRSNASMHYEKGLHPIIVRIAEQDCCKWCSNLAGVYDYPAPREVYRRHSNCKCQVDYKPDKHAKQAQNVHDKQWRTDDSPEPVQQNNVQGSEIVEQLRRSGVQYNPVKKHKNPLSDQQIIDRLAGGDLTRGSCSSLAYAYIGNKHGYDVLDFRGGNSMRFFSSSINIKPINELAGGQTVFVKREIAEVSKIIQKLDLGKEYYLGTGEHAAIVRRLEHGIEYLELQEPNPKDNGWIPFSRKGTEYTLKDRFGCAKYQRERQNRKVYSPVFIAEVDAFKNNDAFEKILGYINTEVNKQRKGVYGRVR